MRLCRIPTPISNLWPRRHPTNQPLQLPFISRTRIELMWSEHSVPLAPTEWNCVLE